MTAKPFTNRLSFRHMRPEYSHINLLSVLVSHCESIRRNLRWYGLSVEYSPIEFAHSGDNSLLEQYDDWTRGHPMAWCIHRKLSLLSGYRLDMDGIDNNGDNG